MALRIAYGQCVSVFKIKQVLRNRLGIERVLEYSFCTALIDSGPLSYSERAAAQSALQQYYYMAQRRAVRSRSTEVFDTGPRARSDPQHL